MTNGEYASLVESYIERHWPGGYPGQNAVECLILDGDDDCQFLVKSVDNYCANCKIWHRLREQAERLYGREL